MARREDLGNPKKIFKNREIENLIKDIRAEASTQKEWITRYTFQALAIGGALWAFAFKLDFGKHGLAFAASGMTCCSLVAFIMLMVSRMANHKYHTINRNLGYELHLYRIKDYYPRERSEKWAGKMFEVGWEEAMCAARVVQATLFNYIYTDKFIKTPDWLPKALCFIFDLRWLSLHWMKPYHVMREHNPKTYPAEKHGGKELYTWYDTNNLIGSKDDYHPGNFLRNMHFTLSAVGCISILLGWGFYIWAAYTTWLDLDYILTVKHLIYLKIAYFGIFGLFNLLFTAFYVTQIIRQKSFRVILESGMLSIQSSAVVWRIVTTCHILGKECAFYKTGSYMSYTRYTYKLAEQAKINFYRIHEWLADLEECHEDQDQMERMLDEILQAEVQPNYFKYLPGQEPAQPAS